MKFPTGKFPVILADPPWTFKTFSNKGKGRSAEKHYGCMTIADIAALPVGDLAAKDCVLLCWVTGPMLSQALDIIEGWGFKYKTLGFSWMKTNRRSPGLFSGMGYWTRSNAELCILATCGKPKRIGKGVAQAILSPRREHSRKPDEQYDRIEKLLAGPYIELFARATRPGWNSWGNQVTKFTNPQPTPRGAPDAVKSKPRKRKTT